MSDRVVLQFLCGGGVCPKKGANARSKGNTRCPGKCCEIQQELRLIFVFSSIGKGIGENQSAFGIGVCYLYLKSFTGFDHVARSECF